MKAVRLLEYGGQLVFVYALRDAAQAWKDMAGNLSPSGPGAAKRRSHGKLVLRVA